MSHCRTPVSDANPNYTLRDVIGTMQIKCPCADTDGGICKKRKSNNNEAISAAGCEWKGQLKDLKEHEKVCMHEVIECETEGCDHKCKRKDMESHLSGTTSIMKHLTLSYEHKMKQMEQRYGKTDQEV